MYESLDLFRLSAAMARHAGQRQALAAVNVANADTPGYRAQTLPSFAESYQAQETMRVTRPGHIAAAESRAALPRDAPGEVSPNGNSVSLETEMFASAEAMQEHAQALAIWRHAVSVLRTSLGR